jgi:integrase
VCSASPGASVAGWRPIPEPEAPAGGVFLIVAVNGTARLRAADAGIRRIRFHDLRHTCATLLLEQGVELITIKELLGHARISTTADIYAHVRPRLQRRASKPWAISAAGEYEYEYEYEDDDDRDQ